MDAPGRHCCLLRLCANRCDAALLALFALPFVLLLLDCNWIVSPWSVDQWVYFGYFQSLPEYLKTFDGLYYTTRLTYLIPGWAAYQLFPPLLANGVLHLGYYYLGVISLYGALKLVFGRRTAFLGAMFLGSSPFYMGAVGADYVDGASIGYFLFSTWMLLLAARSASGRWPLLAAGAAAAALPVNNNFYAILLPVLIGQYLCTKRAPGNSAWRSAVWFAAGGVGLVLILSVINWSVNGRFMFLTPSVRWMMGHVQNSNPYRLPVEDWLPRASFLIFPTLCLMGALFRAGQRFAGRNVAGMIFHAGFITVAAEFLFFEMRGMPVLQAYFYASLLLPLAHLSFTSMLAPALNGLTSSQYRGIATLAAIACIWSAVGPPLGLKMMTESTGFTVVALAGGTAGIVFACRAVFNPLAAGAAVVLVAISQGAARHVCILETPINFKQSVPYTLPLREPVPIWREPLEQFRDVNYSRTAALLATHEAVTTIRDWERFANIWFWFDAADPMREMYRLISSTHLFMYRTLNDRFPSAEAGGEHLPNGLRPGVRLVVLSSQPPVAAATEGLSKRGLGVRVLTERRIEAAPIAFHLAILETTEPETNGARGR